MTALLVVRTASAVEMFWYQMVQSRMRPCASRFYLRRRHERTSSLCSSHALAAPTSDCPLLQCHAFGNPGATPSAILRLHAVPAAAQEVSAFVLEPVGRPLENACEEDGVIFFQARRGLAA